MATTPVRRIARYGWRPDLPDPRDFMYAAPRAALMALPAKADLRSECPPVYDQGPIGSCTANAIAGAVQFDLMKQASPNAKAVPSRLFIYYNERDMEGDIPLDRGAQIRDGVKSVNHLGVCSEKLWPYDAVPATYDGGPFPAGSAPVTRPTADCYAAALDERVLTYHRVQRDIDQFRGCLAAGFPFVFGFRVYESFESAQVARTGTVDLPVAGEQPLGGHAVLAVGYDDTTGRFIVRNSWGTGWGKRGYFTMPYTYLLERGLSSDFWTMQLVTQATAPAKPAKKAAKKAAAKKTAAARRR